MTTTSKSRTRKNGSGYRRPTFKPLWRVAGWWVDELARKHSIIPDHGEARAALARSLGKDRATLNHILTGGIPIPKADIERWADRLKLAAATRRQFVTLGWLGHTPDPIAAAYLRLDRPLAKMVKGLEKRLAKTRAIRL